MSAQERAEKGLRKVEDIMRYESYLPLSQQPWQNGLQKAAEESRTTQKKLLESLEMEETEDETK